MLCTKEEFITHLVIFSKGLVTISVPDNQPIDIGSTAIVTCTPPDIPNNVKWYLTDGKNKTTEITEGKEASLTNTSTSNILTLKDISGSWKGMFLHTRKLLDFESILTLHSYFRYIIVH